MVPAQLGKVSSHLVRRGQALHDPAEGMEQPVPLLVHGWREQLAKLRPAKEQLAVEEAHRLVASVRDVAEGLLDGRDRRVRPGHSLLRNSIGLLAWPRFPMFRLGRESGLPVRSIRRHVRFLWIGRGRA